MATEPSPPPPRSSRTRKPSFAASLLDAIYRSLDADAPAAAAAAAAPDPSLCALDPRKKTTRSEPHLAPILAADARPRPSSASSSAPSDSSSFGFSSDAEPPRPPRSAPRGSDPPPPPKPAKPRSIRSRIREFRRGRGAPSPAPLSCLLRAIFSSAGIARKHKPRAPPPPPPPQPPPQSRSVRFGAVSVAGEEEQERVPGDADLAKAAARRGRVEELMRAMRAMRGEEEEEEEEERSSDSSSDLFELDIACDELPVYETTHPTAINNPSSHARGLLIT